MILDDVGLLTIVRKEVEMNRIWTHCSICGKPIWEDERSLCNVTKEGFPKHKKCKDFDYDLLDPQDAVHELAEHLLGKGWYITSPVSPKQANRIIVDTIKEKYKKRR